MAKRATERFESGRVAISLALTAVTDTPGDKKGAP